MNIVDYAILGILFLSTSIGVYQGFVVAVLNIAAFFISWLSAFIFYPALAQMLQAKTNIVPTLLYYADGSAKIASLDYQRADVSTIPADKISEIVQNAKLPAPFDSLLKNNILNHAFSSMGHTNLNDYFNYTIVNVMINIFCFLLIYFAVRIILNIIISLVNSVVKLPVLRQFDSLLGGCFGFFRGIFVLFIIFALVPIAIAVTPVDIFSDYLNQSLFASFFYKSNIITSIIKGVI